MSKRKFTNTKTHQRKIFFFFLLLCIFFLGIGFANLEANLDIIGVLGLSKYYANYTVNHYMHDLGTDTYTLVSTDTKRGKQNSQLTLENLKKTITGATYVEGYLTGDTTKPTTPAVTTTTILEDGTRVINLYYRRNYLYIKYNVNGGTLSTTNQNLIITDSIVTDNTTSEFLRGVYGSKVGGVDLSTYTVDVWGIHNTDNPDAINLHRTGYSIKNQEEWNTKIDGTGTSYDHDVSTYDANGFAGADLSTGDKVVTLYANWKANEYTVTFAANGGTVSPTTKTVTYDSNYGSLPTPEKDGYIFEGWNGKNLLDYNDLVLNARDFGIEVDENGNISDSAPMNDSRTWQYNNSNWKEKLSAGNYIVTLYFSTMPNNETAQIYSQIQVRDSSDTLLFGSNSGALYQKDKYSFQFSLAEEKYVGLLIKAYDGVYKIQLEKGNTASEWEPYIVKGNTKVTQAKDHTLTAKWQKNRVYNYTGNVQTYVVPKTGKYKLETWGAQGGGNSTIKGGYGGYSTGEISLTENSTLYIVVGGKGNSSSTELVYGGYNGGGPATNCYNVDSDTNCEMQGGINGETGSGGGATHIANTLVNDGLLYRYVDNQSNILLVSGGGGGIGSGNYNGASSGGYMGNQGEGDLDYATGGTQTQGGRDRNSWNGGFGYGTGGQIKAEELPRFFGSGGGGGYYGGGRGFMNGASAGGGSSYIGNTLLSNKAMYCYNCTEDLTNAPTFTVSTTGNSIYKDSINCPNGYSSSPISKCAKSDNGYARITYIG